MICAEAYRWASREEYIQEDKATDTLAELQIDRQCQKCTEIDRHSLQMSAGARKLATARIDPRERHTSEIHSSVGCRHTRKYTDLVIL